MEQRRDLGKWLARVAVAALAGGAVGCNRNAVQPAPSPAMANPSAAAPAEKSSLLASAFAGHPTVAPSGPPPVPEAPPRKTGPLSANTDVAFANSEAESAFMAGRSAVERDTIADAARTRYQDALKKDPEHKGALVGLARLYAKLGDRERAVAAFQSATAAHPKDHGLWFTQATTLAKMSDWPAAGEACRQALALDPENRTYQKTMGYLLARQGSYEDALQAFARVMPEAEARYFLGRTLLDAGRADEGKAQLQYALRADPNHESSRELLVRLATPAGQSAGVPGGGGVATVGHTQEAE